MPLSGDGDMLKLKQSVRRVRMDQVVTIILVVVALALVMRRVMGRASRTDVTAALREEALVVDVRTPGEFASGHADAAINIPLQNLGQRLDELGAKDRVIVLYCQSGGRAASALGLLKRAGFTQALNAGTMRGVEAAR
jgi:phage shock protein E